MSARADRLVAGFEGAEIDALLVADAVNLRYLTGFTGSNGLAVVGPGVRRFVTDFRYVEQAAAEVPDFDRERGPRDLLDALREPWPEGGVRLGFDDAHVSVRTHRRLRGLLPDRVELVPAAGLVEQVRAVKEPGEIDDAARGGPDRRHDLPRARRGGLAGRTEREVAMTLEHRMRVLGADEPSFSSIVASGPRGALPHAQPQDVEIPRDTLVTLDLGAVLDGYASDCTRTWATGEAIPDALAEAYDLTLRAGRRARGGPARPDGRRARRDRPRHRRGGRPRRALRAPARPRGRPRRPRGSPALEGQRAAARGGQRGHRGAGVYLPGIGGVRIEDLVVVTAEGHEVLTHTTKALTVVG